MTNPTSPGKAEELLDLASRCEAADASEQRELLEAAYEAVSGSSLYRDVVSTVDAVEGNAERASQFTAMLEVEAYESAAMQLLPEGQGRGCFFMSRDSFGRTHCNAWTDVEFNRKVHASAATPALALCAASLKARAHTSGERG